MDAGEVLVADEQGLDLAMHSLRARIAATEEEECARRTSSSCNCFRSFLRLSLSPLVMVISTRLARVSVF